MRLEKIRAVLSLARSLAGSAEGMTLDEIAQEFGVSRRTAERMRDQVSVLFAQMDDRVEGGTKRFFIKGGLDFHFQCPTPEELVELNKVIQNLKEEGAKASAVALKELEKKIRAATKRAALLKISTDLEALLRAELIAIQPGPRPVEDAAILIEIRAALLSGRAIKIFYTGGTQPNRDRKVVPYGLIFGHTNFLVGPEFGTKKIKSWRLDRMRSIEVLKEVAGPPPDFNLTDYANRSFGFFHGDEEDVVLRVLPHGIDADFDRWRFHRDQDVERQQDGSAIVRFRSSGMKELRWHLFAWGDKIEIISPTSLRESMATDLRVALGVHGELPRYSQLAAGTLKK